MRFRDRSRARSRFGRSNSTPRAAGSSFRGDRPRLGNRRKFTGQFIHPSKFVNKAVAPMQAAVFTPTHRFVDFKLHPILARNLAGRGFDCPTPIQDQVIPLALAGRDTVGLANTGTGKTAAFLLPILQLLTVKPSAGTVLVLAPTRELAMQIDDEFRALAKGLPLYSAVCVGGMSLGRQRAALVRRPQLVIGTPGRLKDFLDRRLLDLHNVRFLVLDEVDRMLDMGFIRDIRYILDQVPTERQTFCMSATMTAAVGQLLGGLLTNPAQVSVKTGATCQAVEQDIIEYAQEDEKLGLLQTLLAQAEVEKALVFSQTKRNAQRLAHALAAGGVTAEAIHGNKSQAQRTRALQAFKSGRVMALVATDVAARGLDIPNVSHVINYDQPMTYTDYIHRIGRTGRAGQRGTALTFVPGRSAGSAHQR
ncbi:DEAD/DEAH box helicase [Candidatus Berkelbacteria bacterium]|nr:DEAD/DEAH box helicase [Candidatus Berkelbacteria bacterium]